MITYKNLKLQITQSITSADTIISMDADIDCTYIGVITLSNKATKAIFFVKENNLYKARLVITEEDLMYLSNATFHLVLIDSNTSKTTEKVPITFETNKIRKSVAISKSNEIKDVKIELAKLSRKVDEILSRAPIVVSDIEIKENPDVIKPGMVPITIDSKGRCIFQYPFLDVITEINGQKTINSAIILTAKDIPIEQTDVESAIKTQTAAIKELNSFITILSKELKSIKNKVAAVEKALLQHTDSSII